MSGHCLIRIQGAGEKVAEGGCEGDKRPSAAVGRAQQRQRPRRLQRLCQPNNCKLSISSLEVSELNPEYMILPLVPHNLMSQPMASSHKIEHTCKL